MNVAEMIEELRNVTDNQDLEVICDTSRLAEGITSFETLGVELYEEPGEKSVVMINIVPEGT